ncbi:MAG: peptidylprolyl isomerase [Bacilli bacterium]|nr:peptidylprolyl isomerase [Bacilli bacterium]
MKKLSFVLLILVIFITGCSIKNLFVKENESEELMSGKVNVNIDVKDYGVIKLELDADVAPITVTNFVNLAKEHFYDGLTFHRIMDGFMIQGGDPEHNGTGGSEKTIKGEFSSNGVENNISHVRGVISMGRRSNDNNSASSQFFIVHQDSTFLDGNYAAFGKVIEGMEIVDKIATEVSPLATDDNGTIPYENQPVIHSITIEE